MPPWPLIVAALVVAQPATDLAPDVDLLLREQRRVERLVDDELTVRRAVARVHNALAIRWRAEPQKRCTTDIASLLTRADLLLGRHTRDAQVARVAGAELGRLAKAATIAPLLAADHARQITSLVAHAEAAADRHLELRAWHERFVEPRLATCPHTLTGAPGLGDADANNAVVVPAGLSVCPDRSAVHGGVAIVGREACVDAGRCVCTPHPVLPAAVLTTSTVSAFGIREHQPTK
ncbi:MAG: hypothetical protein RMA76_28195 [Deltaproteobacteria bacterium]|jgi:hypothetical protein